MERWCSKCKSSVIVDVPRIVGKSMVLAYPNFDMVQPPKKRGVYGALERIDSLFNV